MAEDRILEYRAIRDGEENAAKIADGGLPINVRQTIEALKAQRASKLFLAWEGTKVPRGIELPNGEKIGWTQHGIIRTESGKDVGYYDRNLYLVGLCGVLWIYRLTISDRSVDGTSGGMTLGQLE